MKLVELQIKERNRPGAGTYTAFINADMVVMVRAGADGGTTVLETAQGTRDYLVAGTVAEVRKALEKE